MPYNQNRIGYQKNKQSQEAASFNSKGKVTIRDQVKIAFQTFGNMTVEEVCELIQRDPISVKPRLTELKNAGVLEDSGTTKMGKWGTSITVWKLANEE